MEYFLYKTLRLSWLFLLVLIIHSQNQPTLKHSRVCYIIIIIPSHYINKIQQPTHPMETKELLLPEIQSKVSAHLSPFTWSNIKLPPFNPIKQKIKSVSEKKTVKTDKQSQTLHLKTIKEQPKQHGQGQAKSKKKSIQKKLKKVTERNEAHTAMTQVVEPRLQNQRYRLKSKVQRLNKTIQLARTQQQPLPIPSSQGEPKRIRFLDDKNNMQKYLKTNLARIGWETNPRTTKNKANLLWSNIDKPSDHNSLKNGQFYNHLNGSFHLTNKDKLHEILSGKLYYSRSYLIPNQYEQFAKENNRIAAKIMLKVIAKDIIGFLKEDLGELMEVHLWEILQSSIFQMGNEQTGILVKLCMYLEEIRRYERYTSYFETFQSYKHINFTPKQKFYDALIQKSFFYLEGIKIQYLSLSFTEIDYRLLILVLHYHKLFSQLDQSYNQTTTPLWIIKPIASSRGAGISLVRSSKEFCLNPDNMWSQFKNRKKYQNKIIQRYIPNPYILQNPPEFAGKKFDIRQWVLVSSNKGRPVIYRYHTGYCRFSHETYTLSKLSKEIHLTNYSIFKNTNSNDPTSPNQPQSIMMLQDLYTVALGDLRTRFTQQINQIITDCILSCPQMKYQEGCFELFGFDFLLDSREKVYLLQVNLNPACNAERHPVLKQESQEMTKSMIGLVTESRPSQKWVRLYGSSGTLDSASETDQTKHSPSEVEIKPYYQYQLTDDESLIAYIRYRNRVVGRMVQIAERYACKEGFNVLTKRQEKKEEEGQVSSQVVGKEALNELIHFIEEKSVSNL